MRAKALALLTVGLLAGMAAPAARAEIGVGLEGGYFVPNDNSFRQLFKEGPAEGFSIHLRTRQGFGALLFLDYYTATAHLQGETFKVTAYPVSLQALYYLDESPHISPFIAAGISDVMGYETNVTANKKIGSNKVGLGGSLGAEFGARSWRVRPYFRFSYMEIPGQSAVQGINLSGYTMVAGATVNFGKPKKPAKPAP